MGFAVPSHSPFLSVDPSNTEHLARQRRGTGGPADRWCATLARHFTGFHPQRTCQREQVHPTLVGSVAIANTLGVLAAVSYLKHGYHRDLNMRTRQDYLQITLAGLICALGNCNIGYPLPQSVWCVAEGTASHFNFIHWFQGDLLRCSGDRRIHPGMAMSAPLHLFPHTFQRSAVFRCV